MLVRGLRLTTDFESELVLALANRGLDPGVETLWLPPAQEHLHVSSTAVRELLALGEREAAEAYVPEAVCPLL